MRKILFKSWFHIIIPLPIWFLLFISPLISSTANISELGRSGFLLHVFISNVLLLTIFYVHSYLLYPLLKQKHFIGYTAAIALLVLLYYSYFLFFRFGPLNGPPVGFRNFRGGASFAARSQLKGPGNFIPILLLIITLLCSFCYRVIIDNASRDQLLKEKETIHLRTELNFLRSQINPHFLFNVLNNMTSLARKKSDMLEPTIINLAQLMRYMLYESADNKVYLVKEVEYLKSYINLQLLRFDDEVSVKAEFTGNYETYVIHPMLLIPIVENAFKYGTNSEDNNLIIITLDVNQAGTELHFKVVNFFDVQHKPGLSDSGIGLSNIQRRLDIVYPGVHEFKTSATNNIFNAELTIKLL
jgi:two-component system LytT family sensor kinase